MIDDVKPPAAPHPPAQTAASCAGGGCGGPDVAHLAARKLRKSSFFFSSRKLQAAVGLPFLFLAPRAPPRPGPRRLALLAAVSTATPRAASTREPCCGSSDGRSRSQS